MEPTTITYLQGDATAPGDEVGDNYAIIAHVCNDQGGWGSGFVVALSARWAKPEAAYRAWVSEAQAGQGAGFALGMVQVVGVEPGLAVANMVAQHGYKSATNPVAVRYDALETCLNKVAEVAERTGAVVVMPRIGCGLAGGDWEVVESVIARTLCAAGVDVYVYDLA
jgi:O-acetyl-ADP-ribose deacetylase (regulator of RNase III)